MLIGHYGASMLAYKVERRLSLSLVFLAAQWLDIVWSVLVLAGVEKLRIVPGFTASNDFDIYSMPYSHSLLAAVLWAMVVFALCRWALGLRWRAAVVLAAIVAGHWFLDLIVHARDLTLTGGMHARRFGLGLWNHPVAGFALELALLCAGVAVVLRETPALHAVGRWGLIALAAVMTVTQVVIFWGPSPQTARGLCGLALFGYLFFAAVAAWVFAQRGVPA